MVPESGLLPMSDPELQKELNSSAFAESVRKLWEVHNSDLRRLESENQKLRRKLRSLEGMEESPQARTLEKAETLKTQSIPSDDANDAPQRQSTLTHQPKSAWARVVPQNKSDDKLFVQTDDVPGSSTDVCKLAEKLVYHPMFDVVSAACIFLNAIAMAMESQYEGLSVGASLQFASLDSAIHTAAWTSAEPAFKVVGYVFGVLFTLELLVKIVGQKWQFIGPESQFAVS